MKLKIYQRIILNQKIAIDVLNGPAVAALNNEGIEVVDAKLILEQARVIKSSDELICMKAAIEVARKRCI